MDCATVASKQTVPRCINSSLAAVMKHGFNHKRTHF